MSTPESAHRTTPSSDQLPVFSAMSDEQLMTELAHEQARAQRIGEQLLSHGLEGYFTPAAEAIRNQAHTSFAGYSESYAALAVVSTQRMDTKTLFARPVFDQLLEEQLIHWATKDRNEKTSVLSYVTERQEADPDLAFTLVATAALRRKDLPRKDSQDTLQAAYKRFITGMPNKKTDYIWSDYCKGYDPEVIYGTFTDQPAIRFSLVPTKFSPEVSRGTVAPQREELEALQKRHPHLGLHVDTPFAQLSRLYTLRAQLSPAQLANFNLTFTRNFDVDAKNGDVPYSSVYDVGDVAASRGVVEFEDGARVAVGQILNLAA